MNEKRTASEQQETELPQTTVNLPQQTFANPKNGVCNGTQEQEAGGIFSPAFNRSAVFLILRDHTPSREDLPIYL